jgi:flagellar biosynthesis protein FlhG
LNAAPQSGLRVVAVTSGKGGVGKTQIAANLAVLGARGGKRVLVIDADLGLANIEVILGVRPERHLGHLLVEGTSLDDVLCMGPHGLALLPAGTGVQALTSLSDGEKRRLIERMDEIEERFDVVIIDTGAGIGDNVCFFAGAAQEVALVVSPEPTSIIDAYAVIKVLSEDVGVTRFGVIVNPVIDERAARDVFPKLTGVAGRFLRAKLRLLGYVPRDENVYRAVMDRRPVADAFPDAPASRALAEVAARLFETPAPVALESGLKFMWQRLLRESHEPAPAPAPAASGAKSSLGG